MINWFYINLLKYLLTYSCFFYCLIIFAPFYKVKKKILSVSFSHFDSPISSFFNCSALKGKIMTTKFILFLNSLYSFLDINRFLLSYLAHDYEPRIFLFLCNLIWKRNFLAFEIIFIFIFSLFSDLIQI